MRSIKTHIIAALLTGGGLSQGSASEYDLVLRGGRVVDGTGNPAFYADVAVKEGRIVAVGKVPGEAKTNLDVHGLAVAPGFIDVHSHSDELDEHPLGEHYARMGVTTIIVGNCGASKLDIGALFRSIEATNVSLNFATLIGHGTVRNKAMGGSFDRPPTAEELERMKSLVEKAMREGAAGLSTGLIYLPGVFAKTDEIVALAKIASAHEGIYASHMRDEGSGIGSALEELFTVARQATIRAEVSHIKLSGKANWGHPDTVLNAIEQARSDGLDVTQDQYLYTASSTGLSQLIPEWAREGGKFKIHLENSGERARIISEMKQKLAKGKRTDYAYATIANCEHDSTLNGLNVVEAARKKRGADSLDDQIELILDVQKQGGASGVFHGISEDDLQAFLRHPNTMIAADSGVRIFGAGVPHPRGYGNSARVLARYVRELKLLRLEDAVRRMTSLPATTFRLKDRGTIRVGAWADVTVFDPAKVQDQATFKEPHHYASGFAWVLVNGVPVVQNDQHTGARPGQALRHQSN